MESDNYRTEGVIGVKSSTTLSATGLTFTWPTFPTEGNPNAGDGYRIIILRRIGGAGITAPQVECGQGFMRVTINNPRAISFADVRREQLAQAINLGQQGQPASAGIIASGTGILRVDFTEQDGDYRQWEEGELSGALIAIPSIITGEGWHLNRDSGDIDLNNATIRGDSTFRGSLQSNNYLRGERGWAFDPNGGGELDSALIRGGIVASSLTTEAIAALRITGRQITGLTINANQITAGEMERLSMESTWMVKRWR